MKDRLIGAIAVTGFIAWLIGLVLFISFALDGLGIPLFWNGCFSMFIGSVAWNLSTNAFIEWGDGIWGDKKKST